MVRQKKKKKKREIEENEEVYNTVMASSAAADCMKKGPHFHFVSSAGGRARKSLLFFVTWRVQPSLRSRQGKN